jgi:hypothetical protein
MDVVVVVVAVALVDVDVVVVVVVAADEEDDEDEDEVGPVVVVVVAIAAIVLVVAAPVVPTTESALVFRSVANISNIIPSFKCDSAALRAPFNTPQIFKRGIFASFSATSQLENP